MFTIPRTVIVCVTTCAERAAPITIGPMETLPPARSRLWAMLTASTFGE